MGEGLQKDFTHLLGGGMKVIYMFEGAMNIFIIT